MVDWTQYDWALYTNENGVLKSRVLEFANVDANGNLTGTIDGIKFDGHFDSQNNSIHLFLLDYSPPAIPPGSFTTWEDFTGSFFPDSGVGQTIFMAGQVIYSYVIIKGPTRTRVRVMGSWLATGTPSI